MAPLENECSITRSFSIRTSIRSKGPKTETNRCSVYPRERSWDLIDSSKTIRPWTYADLCSQSRLEVPIRLKASQAIIINQTNSRKCITIQTVKPQSSQNCPYQIFWFSWPDPRFFQRKVTWQNERRVER